jgi:multisubunit Na+/H+ antiporter MnhG subunit
MNKLVLNIGLLVFCFSIIFYSQSQLTITEILFRALVIFLITTITLSVGAYVLVKTMESNEDSDNKSNETILGKNNNE